MSKIDPRLKFLQQETQEELAELESIGRFSVQIAEVPAPKVTVLLQFSGNIQDLEARGFEPHTVAGDVASGDIELSRLDELADLPNVIRVESSRPLVEELDVSIPEIRADIVHNDTPGYKGSGVIVGIIDSGIDFTHRSFRKPDGTSRILAIWDQSLRPLSGESNPTGYSYGVEYTKSNLDAALASANPFSIVRHQDSGSGHGTHVTGIAAGNGSAPGNDGEPPFTYVGVAPEADIILVSNRVTTPSLGDSASTLDAVNYIFTKADSLGKPAVINQSQGDNLGPHDGTSLLERGIDNLLGSEGKAMVKSAGNAANDDIHASGTVTIEGTETVEFIVPSRDTSPDTIDIWYSGAERLGITITPPGGSPSQIANPGTTTTINLPNGNRVFIDSVLNNPNNNDNRIYIQLSRGSESEIQQGNWAFTLYSNQVTNGHFDAWIERGSVIPRFVPPHLDNFRTISVPGTSKEIISVASYITKRGDTGNISVFSSLGPTRDNRQKPDIAAPGEQIMSAKTTGSGTDQYRESRGTSMSAPHVTGTIALMLERNKNLTQAQIRNYLTLYARKDKFTGTVPNNTWGYGKLDAKAAVDAVSPLSTLEFVDEPGNTSRIPQI